MSNKQNNKHFLFKYTRHHHHHTIIIIMTYLQCADMQKKSGHRAV